MNKESNRTAPNCEGCQNQCKSVLSKLRTVGIDSFDSLIFSQTFRDGEILELTQNKRRIFYCIKGGHLKLGHASGAALRICGAGDVIGYNEYLGQQSYVATAMGPVSACGFDKELFLLVQEKNSEISKEFLGLLSKEIMIRDERIHYLEKYFVKNKVAGALMCLTRKFGIATEFGTKIDVPLDRKTLAQLAGTVIESLARVLTELEKANVIMRVGRHIHIMDVGRLQAISGE